MKDYKWENKGDSDNDSKPRSREVLIHEPKVLETSYNRIYFYSEIDRGNILTLNKTLMTLHNEAMLDKIMRGMDTPYPVYLHINSYGGSIFSGIAGMDQICQIKKNVNVYTIVDGCCASAATFLSVVGTKRYMNKNSFMLIHQLSSGMWGKFDEFKDEMANLERLMVLIKDCYREYTKIPESELDGLLKHDLWFDAEKCIKFGLADEII